MASFRQRLSCSASALGWFAAFFADFPATFGTFFAADFFPRIFFAVSYVFLAFFAPRSLVLARFFSAAAFAVRRAGFARFFRASFLDSSFFSRSPPRFPLLLKRDCRNIRRRSVYRVASESKPEHRENQPVFVKI